MVALRRCEAILAILLLASSSLAVAAPLDMVLTDPFDTKSGLPNQDGRLWRAPHIRYPLPNSPHEQTFVHPVSLVQLTAYALSHNPTTREAFANLQAAAAGLGVAMSGYLPTLTLSSNASRSQQNSTAGFLVPALNSDSTNLSLSYTLLDFGARAAQVNEARAALWIQGFDNNQSLQSVALSVTQNYYQYIGEQAVVAAYKQTVAEDKASLDSAQLQQKSGMQTIADVLEAKSALAQANANLISAQAQVRADAAALAESCGLPPNQHIPVAPLDVHIPPPDITPSVHALIRYALHHNTTVSADAAQILEDRATVDADIAAGLPTSCL